MGHLLRKRVAASAVNLTKREGEPEEEDVAIGLRIGDSRITMRTSNFK